MARWFRFFVILFLGGGIGLIYGWVINPVEYVDTSPGSLREDYKTDYVLMVAEVYQKEQDLDLALERLAFLGDAEPETYVDIALYFAVQSEYSSSDLRLLRFLGDGLSSSSSESEGGRP